MLAEPQTKPWVSLVRPRRWGFPDLAAVGKGCVSRRSCRVACISPARPNPSFLFPLESFARPRRGVDRRKVTLSHNTSPFLPKPLISTTTPASGKLVVSPRLPSLWLRLATALSTKLPASSEAEMTPDASLLPGEMLATASKQGTSAIPITNKSPHPHKKGPRKER